MSKLILLMFSLYVLSAPLSAEADSNKLDGEKYSTFIFEPKWSNSVTKQERSKIQPISGITPETRSFLSSIIGEMNTDLFYFIVVGSIPIEKGTYYAKGIIMPGSIIGERRDEILSEWNIERKRLNLPPVVGGKEAFFGVVKNGKLLLPVENKSMKIEKEWGTAGFHPEDNISGTYQNSVKNGCSLKGYLMSQDLNLDGKPELFSFDGWSMGYIPDENGRMGYLSLHIHDGASGEESFSVILEESNVYAIDGPRYSKAINRDDFEDSGKGGYQKMSKIYLSDLDNNGKLDILIWSRAYEPNKKDFLLSPDGWSFVSEEFKRYEESADGGYRPVLVDFIQAKKWMKEKKLTWRKGFPDKSTCPSDSTEPFTFIKDPVLHE